MPTRRIFYVLFAGGCLLFLLLLARSFLDAAASLTKSDPPSPLITPLGPQPREVLRLEEIDNATDLHFFQEAGELLLLASTGWAWIRWPDATVLRSNPREAGYGELDRRLLDVDGDGRLEVVEYCEDDVRRVSSLDDKAVWWFPSAALGTAICDVDGDGRMEFVLVDAGGTAHLLDAWGNTLATQPGWCEPGVALWDLTSSPLDGAFFASDGEQVLSWNADLSPRARARLLCDGQVNRVQWIPAWRAGGKATLIASEWVDAGTPEVESYYELDPQTLAIRREIDAPFISATDHREAVYTTTTETWGAVACGIMRLAEEEVAAASASGAQLYPDGFEVRLYQVGHWLWTSQVPAPHFGEGARACVAFAPGAQAGELCLLVAYGRSLFRYDLTP